MYRQESMFIGLILLIVMMGACSSGNDEKALIGTGHLNVFSQDIKMPSTIQVLKVDEKITVNVNVKNTGNQAWPNKGNDEKGTNLVALGYYWIDIAGKKIEDRQGASVLPQGLMSGASVSLKATIQVPSQPGDYKLFFSMFQHNVAWFNDKGATPLIVKVKVEK